MANTHPTLLDTLHVLDLADRARSGALTREQLLTCVQGMDTGHTPHELELAADAYLAQGAPAAPGTYDFGWSRPNDPAALDAARNRYSRGIGRFLSWFVRPTRMLGRMILWGAIFMLTGGIGAAILHLGHPEIVVACVISFFLSLVGALVVLAPIEEHVLQFNPCVLGDKKLKCCLAHPMARQYLRAVSHSGTPYLMIGDAKRIDAILNPPPKDPHAEMADIKAALSAHPQ